MSDRFDADYFEVGDIFEGGAIEQSYFISAVMAAGGEVDIYGDTVYIVALPREAKAPVSEPEKVEETVAEPEIEEAPLVDLAHEEVVKEDVVPEPKKPVGRPKINPTPEAEKE